MPVYESIITQRWGSDQSGRVVLTISFDSTKVPAPYGYSERAKVVPCSQYGESILSGLSPGQAFGSLICLGRPTNANRRTARK